MGYPNFGKVKTVVLPLVNINSTSVMTRKEYSDKYGIDIADFASDFEWFNVQVDSKNGRFDMKAENIAFYIKDETSGVLYPVLSVEKKIAYAGKEGDAWYLESGAGIVFHVRKTTGTIANIEIGWETYKDAYTDDDLTMRIS